MKHIHDWVIYNEHDPYAIYAQCSGCRLVAYTTVAQETRLAMETLDEKK